MSILNKMDEDLREIKNIIKKLSRCRDKDINNIILDIVNSKGKMIRPSLVIIASRFGEYNRENTLKIGAIVEMFHMATLVHDDIIDETTLRRGTPTIQSKYGKDYAVYVGDYLLTLCITQIMDFEKEEGYNFNLINKKKSLLNICLGEIKQLKDRYVLNMSIKNYLWKISSKTGELFSISLYAGAKASKVEDKISNYLWWIGHYIGMAYQITDDILDYSSLENKLGKDINSDLKEGIYTLPLLFAMKKPSFKLKFLISKFKYNHEDIKLIIDEVNNLDGVLEAQKIAKTYTDKALRLIEKLPSGEGQDMLKTLVYELLIREY